MGICCTNSDRHGTERGQAQVVAVSGQTQLEQPRATGRRQCVHAQRGPCSQDELSGKAPKLAQEPRDNEKECLADARVVKILANKFDIGQWSFIGRLVPKKKNLFERRQSTRNLGQYRGQDAVGIRRKWMSDFPCNDCKLKSKRHGKLPIRFATGQETIETFRDVMGQSVVLSAIKTEVSLENDDLFHQDLLASNMGSW